MTTTPHLTYASIGAAVILKGRPPTAADVMAVADAGRLATLQLLLEGAYGPVPPETAERIRRQAEALEKALVASSLTLVASSLTLEGRTQ